MAATGLTEPMVAQAKVTGVDRRAFAGMAAVAVLSLGLAAWGWLGSTPQPAYATRALIDLGNAALQPPNEVIVSTSSARTHR